MRARLCDSVAGVLSETYQLWTLEINNDREIIVTDETRRLIAISLNEHYVRFYREPLRGLNVSTSCTCTQAGVCVCYPLTMLTMRSLCMARLIEGDHNVLV